jgi:hypothetical protein
VQEEHAIGIRSITGNVVTVDIFIADIQVALEYQGHSVLHCQKVTLFQGQQHYHDILPHVEPTASQQARDREKMEILDASGKQIIADF